MTSPRPLLVVAGVVALAGLGCAHSPGSPRLAFASSRIFRDASAVEPQAIAIDPAGNAYVVGGFYGTQWDARTGGVSATAGETRTAFLLKLDARGEVLWSRTFGGDTGFTEARSVVVNAAGNAVVVAVTNAPEVRLEGATARGAAGGHRDVLVAAFAPDGAPRWSLRLGGAQDEWSDALTADDAGNVFLSARTQSPTLDVGTGPLANGGPLGSSDVVLVKVRGDGQPEWARMLGGAGEHAIYALAVDAQGRVFAGGSFWDFTPPPSNPFMGRGAPFGGLWLVALDPAGRELWSRATPYRRASGAVGGLAVGRAGELYAWGTFGETLTFAGKTLVGAGRSQIFVASLSPDGEALWANTYGTTTPVGDYVYGLVVDACGDLVLNGDYGIPPVDFGGGPLPTPPLLRPTPFLARLDPRGVHLWSQGFQGGNSNVPRAMAVSPSGDVWLAAFSQADSIDLGGGPIERTGRGAGFVVRYAPVPRLRCTPAP